MKDIEKSLIAFLEDKTKNVAALKGDWGVGKTHFWQEFLKKHRSSLRFRAYSYVSVFGVQSVTDLQKLIFTNADLLTENKTLKLAEKLKPFKDFVDRLELPYIGSTEAVSNLVVEKFVEDCLICFDDLERKESTVTASSVLGVISKLRDKNCKVLLIFNDQKLDEVALAEINEYREKVIDIEWSYSPTIGQNLRIVWPKNCDEYTSWLFDHLDLNNIRVMKKAQSAQNYFENLLTPNYPYLQVPFKKKCSLLTVLHHIYAHEVDLSKNLSNIYSEIMMDREKTKYPASHILRKVDFTPEGFDQYIAQYLLDGYVEVDSILEPLTKLNEKYRLGNVQEQFSKIWEQYRINFQCPQEEFINQMTSFLMANSDSLSLGEIASSIDFVSEIDPTKNLDDLLEKSIDRFIASNDSDRLDINSILFSHLPQSVRDKIAKRLEVDRREYDLLDLFVQLAGKDGWNPRMFKYLMRFSEDDIFHWIISETDPRLTLLLSEFLARFGSQSEMQKEFVQRVNSALERVEQRSNFDRLRIKYVIRSRN